MAKKQKLGNNKSQIKPEPSEEEDLYEDEEQQPSPEPSTATTTTTTTTTTEDSEQEPIQTLLEPFTKEQLIDLLNTAAITHPDVRHRIKTLADSDPVHRKIFVHGLGWDTTAETLTNVFTQYGEIEDCKAVMDKISGKSKGYAFILFKHRTGARNALKEPQKKIGNRMTACQMASAGPVPPPAAQTGPPVSEYTTRKIFVSNVSADINPQKLLGFFEKYGEIVEGPLGLDKQTGKPKGFVLFVYKSVESAKKALVEPHKSFDGHILHCQKAVDGPKLSKTSASASMGVNFPSGQGIASPVGVAFNQPAPIAPAPAAPQLLEQALTALLATQGGALGLTNLLGGAVNANVPPVVNNLGQGMQGGYVNQSQGVYRNQAGYPNFQMGQSNAGRQQGHMGGGKPYRSH